MKTKTNTRSSRVGIHTRAWKWFALYVAEYVDGCGELNCTRAAEDCASDLDIYEDHEDFEIPDWLFDMAVDAESLLQPEVAVEPEYFVAGSNGG